VQFGTGRKSFRASWLALGFILMTGSLCGLQLHGAAAAPTSQADRTADPTLRLRVYNYAHIDRGLLTRSEQVATDIFKSVGVEIVWLDCPLSQAQYRAYPACQRDVGPPDFVLRILPRQMAVKLSISDEPLGFARPCTENEPACALTIFYYRVDEMAADGYRADRILGFVIAHEITHALIGPGHSEQGIMRAAWSSGDLQRISWGLPLNFTPDQAARVRSASQRRTNMR
jgi:hypothetical protein